MLVEKTTGGRSYLHHMWLHGRLCRETKQTWQEVVLQTILARQRASQRWLDNAGLSCQSLSLYN